MKPETAEAFADLAADMGLATAAELRRGLAEAGGEAASPELLGNALLRQEVLTRYQLDRLLRGDRQGYFFGTAKILYQVGAGAFARVYRGVQQGSGETVAVKVLRSRYAGDPEKCREFRREGEMGRLLRHPNIVAIEDVGEANDTSYITMEFMEGQTLRELVKIRGAIEPRQTIDLVVQLLRGLDYAHRRGVTHRDMKASNVLVSATGTAKLVDFGLAGIDAEHGDAALGQVDRPRTVDYAALEKLSGMKNDDVRSDLYFLGTIAYLAAAGSSPLGESRDRAARSDPQRFTRVEPLKSKRPDVPADVREAISRLMHVDPLERYQTASDALRVFEHLATAYASEGHVAAVSDTNPEVVLPSATKVQPRLMLVERSGKRQDALRKFLAALGYRVLVTENPQRALARFSSVPPPAEGLVICGSVLGEEALAAFNQLTSDPFLVKVPAVLLVGSQQQGLARRATCDRRRKVVSSPIDRDLMEQTLAGLLEASG